MKFTVGKKITIRVTDYIIKHVKVSSGAVRKLIEFHDKTGNTYVWGVVYNTPFPEEGVKYVSAKIQNIKETEDGQIIVLTGAKDITAEKEEQLAKRRAKAAAKKAGKEVPPKEEPKEDLPPTVGGDPVVDTNPPAEPVSSEVVEPADLNSAEKEAAKKADNEPKKEEPKDISEQPESTEQPKEDVSTKSAGWQSFGISDTKAIRLTEAYIRKMFDVFNKAYFGGALSLDGVKVIPYGAIRRAAGYVRSYTTDRHVNWGLGPKDIAPREDYLVDGVDEFCIGEKRNAPKRTEKSWCEIILHEMIHVYQHKYLRRTGPELQYEQKGAHGPTFTVKMKEINEAGGWDISVSDDKLGGIEISDTKAKEIQEQFYLVTYGTTSRRQKANAVVLMPKSIISEAVFKLSVRHGDISVYEIHNAESISKIEQTTEAVPRSWQVIPSALLQGLIDRGDISKVDIEVDNTLNNKDDNIAKDYYLFIGERGSGRAKYDRAFGLVPKGRLSDFIKDRGRNFYRNGKLYYINNGMPFEDFEPYRFDGGFYTTTKSQCDGFRKFLGEEINMTESVDIKDLKPELRQIYESIFYESNPDEDIFDSMVDDNNKVIEKDGQKVLYSLTF